MISIKEASKILGVSEKTLRIWEKEGKITASRTEGGHRRYEIKDLIKSNKDKLLTIAYARVSSNDQKEDLKRQEIVLESYCASKGFEFEVISDLGSGLNYKKKGLKELLKLITQNKVDKVVVLYEDRLLRFGYELVEYLASLYNCEIEIIDNTEKSEQQELVEDLVQIITVFSCKLQGKRANKAKKLIRELINGESEVNENDKRNKSNVST